MESKMLMTVYIGLIALLVGPWGTNGDCGFPGRPHGGEVYPLQQRYSENQHVSYMCYGKIIGNRIRTCLNGRWSGSIPRCGNHYSNSSLYFFFQLNVLSIINIF